MRSLPARLGSSMYRLSRITTGAAKWVWPLRRLTCIDAKMASPYLIAPVIITNYGWSTSRCRDVLIAHLGHCGRAIIPLIFLLPHQHRDWICASPFGMDHVHIIAVVSVGFTLSRTALRTFSHVPERSASFPAPDLYFSPLGMRTPKFMVTRLFCFHRTPSLYSNLATIGAAPSILTLDAFSITMVAGRRSEGLITEVATAVAVVALDLPLTAVRTFLVAHNPPHLARRLRRTRLRDCRCTAVRLHHSLVVVSVRSWRDRRGAGRTRPRTASRRLRR